MENSNGKGTILLVDDEDVVLVVGTMMLEKLGYNVLAANNGLDAAQFYRDKKENICLVVLDVLMPKVSGSETCRRIKAINPKAKILHTSGLDAGQLTQDIKCGCDSILQKPFRLDNLSDKISEMLDDSKE
jgi:two-component system cell cycle sensor histidine kinase/response regulator CckA